MMLRLPFVCALSAPEIVIVSLPSVPVPLRPATVVSMTSAVLFQKAAVSMPTPPDVPETRMASLTPPKVKSTPF